MLKYFLYISFAALYLLLTFFGLGPVLFADGSTTERIITLLVVILFYIILTFLFKGLLKRAK